MPQLICQLWKKRVEKLDREQGPHIVCEASGYSLHLNHKHRMMFIHKNAKGSNLDLSEYFEFEPTDDIFQKVLDAQTKHGLKFKGYPAEDILANPNQGDEVVIEIALDDIYKEINELKMSPNITDIEYVKFLNEIMSAMSVPQNFFGEQI